MRSSAPFQGVATDGAHAVLNQLKMGVRSTHATALLNSNTSWAYTAGRIALVRDHFKSSLSLWYLALTAVDTRMSDAGRQEGRLQLHVGEYEWSRLL